MRDLDDLTYDRDDDAERQREMTDDPCPCCGDMDLCDCLNEDDDDFLEDDEELEGFL